MSAADSTSGMAAARARWLERSRSAVRTARERAMPMTEVRGRAAPWVPLSL